MRKSYMEALISGEVTVEDVTKFRQEWSRYENDSLDMSCAEYFGMSEYEYRISKGGCCKIMMPLIIAVRLDMVLDY